jgi:hypothetical protein
MITDDLTMGTVAHNLLIERAKTESDIHEVVDVVYDKIDRGGCNCDGATDAMHLCHLHRILYALGVHYLGKREALEQ